MPRGPSQGAARVLAESGVSAGSSDDHLRAASAPPRGVASSLGAASSALAPPQGAGQVGPRCVVGGDYNMTAVQVDDALHVFHDEWTVSDTSPTRNRDFLFSNNPIVRPDPETPIDQGGVPLPLDFMNMEKVHALVVGRMCGGDSHEDSTGAPAPSRGAQKQASAIMEFMQDKQQELMTKIEEVGQKRDERVEQLREEQTKALNTFWYADDVKLVSEANARLHALLEQRKAVQREADAKMRTVNMQKTAVESFMKVFISRKRQLEELEAQEDDATVQAEAASAFATSRGAAASGAAQPQQDGAPNDQQTHPLGAHSAPPQGASQDLQQALGAQSALAPPQGALDDDNDDQESEAQKLIIALPTMHKIPTRTAVGWTFSEKAAHQRIARILDHRAEVMKDMGLCDTAGSSSDAATPRLLPLEAQTKVQKLIYEMWLEENPKVVAENNSRFATNEQRSRNLRSRYRAAMHQDISGVDRQWQYK